MSYLDKDFKPAREFWRGFYIQNKCNECGWCLNGGTYTWQLLDGPVDVTCSRCGAQWSVAIPLGDCPERQAILNLLGDELRFYKMRDELRKLVARLHGHST